MVRVAASVRVCRALPIGLFDVEEPQRLSRAWVTQGLRTLFETSVSWTLTASEGGVTTLHLAQSGLDSEVKREVGGAKDGWTAPFGQGDPLRAGG